MTRDVIVLFYLFVCLKTCGTQSNYPVPDPVVKVLYPKGFIVSIKDDGFSFIRFHGSINYILNMFDDFELYSGTWFCINRDIKLELGDIIYYRIHVGKKGQGHVATNHQYKVTEFVREDGTPVVLPGQPNHVPSGPSQFPPQPSDFIDKVLSTTEKNCPLSKTIVQGRTTVCKDSLIFHEEFDKDSLRDLVQWAAEVKFPREPDFPFNVYIPDNTVGFEDGSLVITPVLTESLHHEGFLHEKLNLNTRCTGRVNTVECNQVAYGAQIIPPVTTAKITTKRNFNFKFGRVEVRAKLPSGSWLIPEINLEPSQLAYGPDRYASGLMRIAFARGNLNQAKKLYGGPILSDSEPHRSLLLQQKIGYNNWHNDFHNYTMIWKPGVVSKTSSERLPAGWVDYIRERGTWLNNAQCKSIELYADGEQYGTINPGEGFHTRMNGIDHANNWVSGTVMAPLDQLFHITLGLRVGGINDFPDELTDKPWKNRASKAMLDFWKRKSSWHQTWYNSNLKIDYVRVFAL